MSILQEKLKWSFIEMKRLLTECVTVSECGVFMVNELSIQFPFPQRHNEIKKEQLNCMNFRTAFEEKNNNRIVNLIESLSVLTIKKSNLLLPLLVPSWTFCIEINASIFLCRGWQNAHLLVKYLCSSGLVRRWFERNFILMIR